MPHTFSENSDMSTRISASSSSNRNSASALASSVLPTPVGPAKMNEPPQDASDTLRPTRVRRIERDSAETASSWPMMRLCSSDSMPSSFFDSAWVSLNTGMPVVEEITWAITSSFTTISTSDSPSRQEDSFSLRSASSFSWLSRSSAAFSKSWSLMALSFSAATFATFWSSSLSSGGAVRRLMRSRAPASSIRSMALSGRLRSWM